ncbi:hypothetical protein F4V91_08585 [Neorhizobium galegae]|uniref:Uncharacterized protein n=1 Tax=Neorhizobium galegae TaxID=399 RepID=A0A6A1TQN9_NEOGA|nr:hypothetical protein [Neorhizobium galegae]KAB1086480.1 hypothetical protein F4V91_08585 [Neorhizobium galegae]
MTDNTAQIAALRDAIASGARRIQFRSGGTQREVEYHSLSDMMKALEWLEAQQSSRPRITRVAF